MSPEVQLRKLSVALLSWNGREHLELCLQALATQEDPGSPWEILLLDNGSTDGTADWVRRAHPRVRLLESPTNLGFCVGYNRLVDAAEGDAVLLLNNDTRPAPSWLAAHAAALRAAPADVTAIAGLIVDWEGERLDFARGLLAFDGHALQEGFRRRLGSVPLPAAGEEVLVGCAANLLVRRSSYLAAGGFDPSYFAYYEDVDLSWRLWARGERIIFAPEAVVRHRSQATSDHLGRYNRGFLFERNAFWTAYKNYEPGLWEQMMPAILLTLLVRTQALLVENNPGGATLAVDPYASGGPAAAATTRSESPLSKGHSYGLRETARRAARKLRRFLARRGAEELRVSDPRTVAQLRAISYLLGHLPEGAARRRAVQAERRRSDREIFARFPLHLIPTYPGDERLFRDPGFRAWLPEDLPLVERRLDEVMEL